MPDSHGWAKLVHLPVFSGYFSIKKITGLVLFFCRTFITGSGMP